MKLNLLEKSVLAAAIFGALATGTCTAKADSAMDVPGIQAIVQTDQVEFIEETTSKQGDRLFWRFGVYSITEECYVIVTVPAGTTPDEFNAHCTVAFDAVHFYREGIIPAGNDLEVDVPFITNILKENTNVRFLGVVPNMNHTNTRWMFYVGAMNGAPAVVVNLSPNCTEPMQFVNAYFTAEDAVRQYIRYNTKPAKRATPVIKGGTHA